LSPAACYPVYPIAAERGRLPEGGLLFDIEADCFRHEPSPHLDRLQSFRMREFVRIGSPQEILEFRERWIARSPEIAGDLGLPHTIDVASDPFFGRVGQVMAISQRQQALKFELLIPFHATATPTACMSFNYHREHFGTVWGIHGRNGETAHTSCVAFGIDRLTVALFAVHGVDLAQWPERTRQALTTLANGYLVDQATLDHDLLYYLPPGADPADPRISPLRTADLSGVPPTIIHTAEFDPLRDEGCNYFERLTNTSVAVSYTCHPGMIHLFYGLGAVIPYARTAFEQFGADIRAALA
jgi:hypothetical protein